MTEVWRDIPGLEGRYQISSAGRVKSVARHFNTGGRGTRMICSVVKKPRVSNQRYLFVMIHIGGQYKRFYIHRSVASAFLPNPDGLPIVNHKDRNRQNNNLSNLEWVTASENQQHWRRTPEYVPALAMAAIADEDLPDF